MVCAHKYRYVGQPQSGSCGVIFVLRNLGLEGASNNRMALRYHPDRDRLLAEAHARPSTPLDVPVFATRIATLGDQDGGAADRAHLAELCRMSLLPEPPEGSRWWSFAFIR